MADYKDSRLIHGIKIVVYYFLFILKGQPKKFGPRYTGKNKLKVRVQRSAKFADTRILLQVQGLKIRLLLFLPIII
jgi:hypothetical protein